MAQNLMNFGAATSIAANARDANGFLTYGNGWGAPLGAGILSAEGQSTQNQQAQAALQSQNIQNQIASLQIPYLQGRAAYIQRRAAGGSGMPDDDSTVPTLAPPPGAGASQGTDSSPPPLSAIGSAITSTETGNNPDVTNPQGYTGAWQAGTAALASDGMYTPAKGEDLTKNQWLGTVNVPGYGTMTPAQYQGNTQAQYAALQIHMNNLMAQGQKMGLDNYIGQTIGGVPITIPSLMAMGNFAGLAGTQKFLQSGGKYNPSDANGTTLSSYAMSVLARMPAPGQSSQGQQSASDQSGGFLPPGAPTPMQAYKMAEQLYAQAQTDALYGLPSASVEEARAAQFAAYTFKSLEPVTMKDGSVYLGPNGIYKDGKFTTVYDSSNIGHPAMVMNELSRNGQPYFPGNIQMLGSGSSGGSASAATAGGTAGPVFPLYGFKAPSSPSSAPAGSQSSGSAAPDATTSPGTFSTTPYPFLNDLNEEQAKQLVKDGEKYANDASGAVTNQFYLSQMREASKNFQPGSFANVENAVATHALSFAQAIGMDTSGPGFAELNKTTGNFSLFKKDSTNLVANMLKTTGGRVTVAEMNYYMNAIPSASSPPAAIAMLTDQLQAINSMQIAKGTAYGQWMSQMSSADPKTAAQMRDLGFNVWFNSNVGPTVFLFNEWSKTPEGQATLASQLQQLNATPQGKQLLGRLVRQSQWAQQNGLFDIAGDDSQ